MGSLQSTHFHHDVNRFDSEFGCDHYDSSTVIKEVKWKVVPFSSELSQKILRRVLKLAGRLTVEATSGINANGIDSKHDVIQCEFYYDTCHKERFITIEFSPEGGYIRNGKYTVVYQTKDSKFTKDYTFSIIERAYK